MTAGEAEFHAEGVGLLASAGEATGTLVSRLGAFERLYQRGRQKNTTHFFRPRRGVPGPSTVRSGAAKSPAPHVLLGRGRYCRFQTHGVPLTAIH
jgi:hypothetical protein